MSFRNENSIEGSRSLTNKIDLGMVSVRVSNEELMNIAEILEEFQIGENEELLVVDVYKNRSGSYDGIRIVKAFDFGTCRSRDLFMTTASWDLITPDRYNHYIEEHVTVTVEELEERMAYEFS